MDNKAFYITTAPEIMQGKPVIGGTRITVERILEKLAIGDTVEQILEDYPNLSREQVYGAITFALENLKNSYKQQVA